MNSEPSSMIKVPFTVRDILSHVLPGATLFLCTFAFDYFLKRHLPDDQIARAPVYAAFYPELLNATTPHWAPWTLYFLILLLCCYLAGHLVSTLSSLFIDRIMVAKVSGYPYELLLSLTSPQRQKGYFTRAYFSGLYFWLNFNIFLYFLSFLVFRRSSLTIAIILSAAIIIVTILTAIAHLCANKTEKLLRTRINRGKISKDQAAHALNPPPALEDYPFDRVEVLCRLTSKRTCWLKATNHVVNKWFYAPYSLITRLIGSLINIRAPFPKEFQADYRRHFTEIFGLDPQRAGSLNYWHCRAYIGEHSQRLNASLDHFYNLFSAVRNLSVAFYLAFIYCFISLLDQFHKLENFPRKNVLLIITLIYFILAFIMVARYYYIYFCYYNKCVFRSFLFLAKTPTHSGAPRATQNPHSTTAPPAHPSTEPPDPTSASTESLNPAGNPVSATPK